MKTQLFTGVVVFCLATISQAEPSPAPGTPDSPATQSLAGDWRFEIAPAEARGFDHLLPGTIRLPGTMDSAGLGPKNTAKPTLAGPYRTYDYAGPAWYQRDIEIPAAWQGKRVTLFLERCRWVTTVYLDDKPMGTRDSLISPHVYDFGTVVAPGKHRLTICVDNTVKINLGVFVSALFGGIPGNLNGIVGRIELAATPATWIDDVQVYPNLPEKKAHVKVTIGNATGKPVKGDLVLLLGIVDRTIGLAQPSCAWECAEQRAVVEMDVPMNRVTLPWDEFSPIRYSLLARLYVKNGEKVAAYHDYPVTFGLREFAVKGTQFTLNGRPVYLRGTLECQVFPLTGHPPMDVASWRKIYGVIKSYGLNHMRFHSWCPPEAAFAAADEEGIMLQVEGPMANVPAGKDAARDAFIEAEYKRIVDTYGNHPSFCTMTLGNEFGGDDALLSRWVDMLIHRDGRHLYSSASCAQKTANRQWTEEAAGRGIHGPGTQHDLGKVVAADSRPNIGHEIGQWMFYPDFNEMKKYTGVVTAKNFELVREDLEKKHQLDLAGQYVQASGKFAVLLYKEEIEVLLRTRGYAGFSLLDLHDYPTQGTALIGPLDAFWDSKGFIKPEEYRRFCSATVPLLRLPKRAFSADETLEAAVDVAHYGPADLKHVTPQWTVKDDHGRELAAGTLDAVDLPTGKLTPAGAIKASLAKAAAPAKLTVTVSLPGTEFANDWEIWVYPAAAAPAPPADVVVAEKWDQARAALAAGKKVVYFAFAADTAKSMKGRFLPVFWSPVWFPSQKPNTMGLLCDPSHPLFAQFPTEFHTNWQWYDLMQRSRMFELDDSPGDYRPIVQIIDNFARNHRLGLVFEARVGKGQLLACGIDLPHLSKDPAGRQFLASLYAYVASAAFHPEKPLADDVLEAIFVPHFTNRLRELGGTVRADSHAEDYDAANALDGDGQTFWHTPWGSGAPIFPHYLIVEFPQAVKLAGLTCLPRQDMKNGRIKEYAVYVSADGKNWGQPVASGAFANNGNRQEIKFAQSIETRFLKFVAVSNFDPASPFASLAELDALGAGK